MKNIIALRRSQDQGRVRALVEKILGKQAYQPQVSERFSSNQDVQLVVMRTGLLVPTKMKNYSASGAFLEYRGISIRVGDFLQIGISDQHPNVRYRRHHQFQAKVVWMQMDSKPNSAKGIGVQFIDGIDH